MKKKGVETDKCVSCNKDTGIPKNAHVDSREHYIEGAGQLCKECFKEIYKR